MMFIKHYAPNRCLCIKVAKSKNGSYCEKEKKRSGACQGSCERRSESFVKIQKKMRGGGGQVGGCERRREAFVKIKKKWGGGGRDGGGARWM